MKQVTAKDVAESVGCSVASVSLVVNNRAEGRINDALRDRILEAVARLNYRPNQYAQSLATRSKPNVALVCPDMRNPFFGELFHGLSHALEGHFGVDLRVGEAGGDYGPKTVEDAQAANIAGLVLANPAPDVLAQFHATCPTLLVDSPGSTLDLAKIDFDIEAAAEQLADHLVKLGHRRVGYIDLDRFKDTFVQRRKSLEAELGKGGGELAAITSVAEISVFAGYEAFVGVISSWRRQGITAVICADDVLAYGAIKGARTLDIGIPGDLSLASFNDIPFSELIRPSLTSVRLGGEELGREAGSRILSLIRGGEETSSLLSTQLATRESTGPAPAGD